MSCDRCDIVVIFWCRFVHSLLLTICGFFTVTLCVRPFAVTLTFPDWHARSGGLLVPSPNRTLPFATVGRNGLLLRDSPCIAFDSSDGARSVVCFHVHAADTDAHGVSTVAASGAHAGPLSQSNVSEVTRDWRNGRYLVAGCVRFSVRNDLVVSSNANGTVHALGVDEILQGACFTPGGVFGNNPWQSTAWYTAPHCPLEFCGDGRCDGEEDLGACPAIIACLCVCVCVCV